MGLSSNDYNGLFKRIMIGQHNITLAGRPLLAELRSSWSATERLLWRKLTLKSHFSAAESDPQETPRFESVRQVTSGFSLNRFASTQPAEPAPTMM
jgi:hypothetical protein